MLNQVEENNFIATVQNCVSMESSLRHDLPKLKKAVRQTIHEKFKEKFNCQAEKLVFQGDFATLLSEENLDVTWKSYIYSVPKGVMSFAM